VLAAAWASTTRVVSLTIEGLSTNTLYVHDSARAAATPAPAPSHRLSCPNISGPYYLGKGRCFRRNLFDALDLFGLGLGLAAADKVPHTEADSHEARDNEYLHGVCVGEETYRRRH